jgi:3-hydroxyisobutyrate dehydrogenase-like beta-hydroxyacid dehydrogenase
MNEPNPEPSEAPNKPIGFIGLGSMGAALAERFLAAGCRLVVHDLDGATVRRFCESGAEAGLSALDVADRCETVFACLPTTQISFDVALGANGVVAGKEVRVYVETSTIGFRIANEIAEGLHPRIGFIDAPVSGGPPGARAGTLTTMVSGPRETFARVQGALSIMAKNVFYVGERPGQAQIAKLVNNHLSAAHRIATFEGLVLALKAGLDLPALIEVINASSGRSYTTTDKVPAAILSGSFKFNGRLAISIKDQTLLAEEAAELGVPLWVAPRLLETLKEAAAAGYLEKDSMQLIQYMGERAGLDVATLVGKAK